MKQYEVSIVWSEEDQLFVAAVPDLPGCMAHGTSREAALARCQEAMEHWIATAEELGRPLPDPTPRRNPA